MENKRAIWGWALYDWADSAFATTVMAGFFPIYFKTYCSAGTPVTLSSARLGVSLSVGTLAIVLITPWLAAIADARACRKKFLIAFTLVAAALTASLALVGQGDWRAAIALYVAASLFFAGALGFYDSLLPSVASQETIHRVSALGYGLGYLGGGILFALNVVMYQKPQWFGLAGTTDAIKASLVSVGLWWILFSLPLFLWVPEPVSSASPDTGASPRSGFAEMTATFRSLRQFRTILFFLGAFFLYNDAVGTTMKMAIDYGLSIGFQASDLISALLLVQFIGFPSTILFGRLASRFPPRYAIYFCMGIYILAIFWAMRMHRAWEFYCLAIMIGGVQGGIQSISRSFYSRLIPQDKSAQFYGFYNLLGKFSGLLGPALVGLISYATGNPRLGILSIAIFFILGGLVLTRVDETQAQVELDLARCRMETQ